MGSLVGVIRGHASRLGMSEDEYLALRRAGLKFCWRCRAWQPVAAFGIDRSRYDGLAAKCMSCCRRPQQLKLIRPTPAERDRLRYATDEKYRAQRRQHAHARTRGVAPLPMEGIETLTDDFGGLCAYCPSPATTWDHLVPVWDGGRTIPGNIVPACVSCNSRKKNMDLNEFIERYGIDVSAALESVIALGYEIGQLQ